MVEVFKIKKKYYKKLRSYGEFYKRVGVLKFVKALDYTPDIQQIQANKEVYYKIHEAIKNSHMKYEWRELSGKVKRIKRKKSEVLKELPKFLLTRISMDSLNYAPKTNDDLPDNTITFFHTY